MDCGQCANFEVCFVLQDELRDGAGSGDFLEKGRIWRVFRSERNDILLVVIECSCMSLYRIRPSDLKWDISYIKSMQMNEALVSA